MFGFGKKKKKNQPSVEKEQKPKKKSRADKIVMGAIIGVAIGSVISMSFKPKKNKKTGNKADIAESPRKIPSEAE